MKLTENEVVLDEKQKTKLLCAVEKLEQDGENHAGCKILDSFFSGIPCEENGLMAFDYDKFCAMVLFLHIDAIHCSIFQTVIFQMVFYLRES